MGAWLQRERRRYGWGVRDPHVWDPPCEQGAVQAVLYYGSLSVTLGLQVLPFFFLFFSFATFPFGVNLPPSPPTPQLRCGEVGQHWGYPRDGAVQQSSLAVRGLCSVVPPAAAWGDVQGWTPHPRLAAQSPSAIANKYIRQSPLPGTGLGRSCREEDGCGEVGSAPPAVNPQEL